jgi:hypothetical protein
LKNIGIITVATKGYVDYWKKMYQSHLGKRNSEELHFYVFTDNSSEIEKFVLEIGKSNVTAIPIESWGWPEATLYRYKFISENRKIFNTPILMHIDADMRIELDFVERVMKLATQEMVFVEHPGFIHSSAFLQEIMSFRGIFSIMRDFKFQIMEGGLGTWEKRRTSKAFLPRRKRTQYYCGGVWYGDASSFIDFASELAARTIEDLNIGLIARHNDESHLNWFAGTHKHTKDNAEMCFDGSLERSKYLVPAIVALNKGLDWIRVSTYKN